MNITITKPPSGGAIEAVASKSHAHRLLICAALSDKTSYIECSERSDDIDATVACLESLGAQIRHDGTGFNVVPLSFPLSKEPVMQVCGESGATLRFMLPVCAALGVPAMFVTVGSLRERPTSPLLEQLASNGCEITMSKGNLACFGKLQSGDYTLQGNVSSQFISGLLMALPLIDGDSVINVEGKVESMPYVTLTLDVLRSYGINARMKGTRAGRGAICLIEGSQKYISPGDVKVEGDWSNAAAWLGAGVLGGSGVTCSGLNLGSSQGDMAILRQMGRFGASVEYEGDTVYVSPAKKSAIQFDASNTPDLVPILALIASVSEGETIINNAGRLRLKESDRLNAVAETLKVLGADISEMQDGLAIKGKRALKGGTVTSFGDHRIVMMAAIASVVCENPVTIIAADSVNKSYPGFFKDFEKLGGEIAYDGGCV
ncbi:MAG: 3-phosphoshikimate 1-carboxyvinyltransferase [Oscillospiraceae bacterium]|nr:3-phosphoshikimate 1-carboxyvinyltransferase [Oscillospiraceae bacterium]